MNGVEWALCGHGAVAKGTALGIEEQDGLKLGRLSLKSFIIMEGGKEEGGEEERGEEKLFCVPAKCQQTNFCPLSATYTSWHNLVKWPSPSSPRHCLAGCTASTPPTPRHLDGVFRWEPSSSRQGAPQRNGIHLKTEGRARDPCTCYSSAGCLHAPLVPSLPI